MPKLTYAENPVHPVLNDYPAALVPTSLAFDMLHLVTRRPTFRNAAFFTLLFAFATGGAAAVAGFEDYREIPEGTEAKRMANAHALLNLGLMGAIALQLLIRFTGRVGFFARFLNVASTAGLVVSSWYGTHLVYRHGVRVRGVDPIAESAEETPDPGKPFADRLESLLRHVPDTDLSGYVINAGDAASTAGRQAQGALETATREMGSRTGQVREAARSVAATVTRSDATPGGGAAGSDTDFSAETEDAAEPVDIAAAVRERLPDDEPR